MEGKEWSPTFAKSQPDEQTVMLPEGAVVREVVAEAAVARAESWWRRMVAMGKKAKKKK